MWSSCQRKTMYCSSHSNDTHTHTHTFNGPLSGTTRVSQYQKGKTNLDFTEARDSEWQWHQLGHMQVCTSLQADNHASTPPLSFLQAGWPSCHPTNSVKALKANHSNDKHITFQLFWGKCKKQLLIIFSHTRCIWYCEVRLISFSYYNIYSGSTVMHLTSNQIHGMSACLDNFINVWHNNLYSKI